MNIEEVRCYCLSKAGATEDAAFGPDTVLFRLCNKIFACLDLTRPDRVVINSSEEKTVELRAHYQGICEAWHWNKHYWSEVALDQDVDEDLIKTLIDESYERIRTRLPKKTLFNFPDLPQDWVHHHFAVTESTSLLLRSGIFREEKAPFLLLTADFQTAGRGQGTNRWEAKDKQNLLFSFRFFPKGVSAVDQFVLLQVVSLAVAATLQSYVGSGISIKWPNDIYYGENKLCGILIEHDLCGGKVLETRCGIGINVNQRQFVSDAPNPISLYQILGKEVDRAAVLRRFLKAFEKYRLLQEKTEVLLLTDEYMWKLYRRTGLHAYRDVQGLFWASFHDIDHAGRLVLRTQEGDLRSYAHKEVSFVSDLIGGGDAACQFVKKEGHENQK